MRDDYEVIAGGRWKEPWPPPVVGRNEGEVTANCSRFANPHQPILKQPPLRSALVIGSRWFAFSV